jgi:hypothetical protein
MAITSVSYKENNGEEGERNDRNKSPLTQETVAARRARSARALGSLALGLARWLLGVAACMLQGAGVLRWGRRGAQVCARGW